MVEVKKGKRTFAFREDLCNLCGLCFHLCPVMHLPIEIAKEEIKNLIEGKESKYALKNCNTCHSCNLYCPQQANPYQLILERWNDLYKKRGAPPLYRFVCPTEQPNIWQLLNIFLSEKEKKWINAWMNYIPKPDDTILLIGNYTHLFPFIIGGSKLLGYFKPIDRIDQWEGGAYLYQGGYLDIVQKIAQRTKEDFDSWGVKNVVATLDAVEFIFSEVHPKEMSIEHSQTFINFHKWLLDNINSGEVKFKKKLNFSVTVHDNCYSKARGGKYWEKPREILSKCGCEIIEMKHNRKDSLCCGFGAGASWVENLSIPFDIISEGTKKFREAEETGAKALISYCGGCIYLLWATKELLSKCGCEIIEMKHNRKDSLCCGFGAGASWVKNLSIPFDIISEGTKKFREAEETGAKALISYCGGCIYLLWATKELLRSKIDLFHIIEVVRMAIGEKLNYPIEHKRRAWDIISIITYQLLISIFQKNFFIRNITYDKERSTFKPKKHRLLKLIRLLFEISLVRKFYAKLFQLLMPIMKTR